MMLLEKEDVVRLGVSLLPFHPKQPRFDEDGRYIQPPEDELEAIGDGPFLFIVNEQDVWAGRGLTDIHGVYQGLQGGKGMGRVAMRRDPSTRNRTKYRNLCTLYVEDLGWTPAHLFRKMNSIRKRLREAEEWVPWDEIYHWNDGSDRLWSSASFHHPWIKTRERDGVREARRKL